MQKSVTGLTVALATALALIMTIPNAVLGGVTKVPPANEPDSNGTALPCVDCVNISLRDAIIFSKGIDFEITVEELKRYDLNHDGFLSEDELNQLPMFMYDNSMFRNIDDYMKISLQNASKALEVLGLNITVENLKQFDVDEDGFLYKVELNKIPMGWQPTSVNRDRRSVGRKMLLKGFVLWSNSLGIQVTEREMMGFDLNHDGLISNEEYNLIPDEWSWNKDPFTDLIENQLKVSLEDVVKFLKEREYEVTLEVLTKFDLDGDGFLCNKDINKIPPSWRPEGPASDVVDNFKISLRNVDALFKGYVITDRSKSFLKTKPFDLNNDDFMSYNELKAIPRPLPKWNPITSTSTLPQE